MSTGMLHAKECCIPGSKDGPYCAEADTAPSLAKPRTYHIMPYHGKGPGSVKPAFCCYYDYSSSVYIVGNSVIPWSLLEDIPS